MQRQLSLDVGFKHACLSLLGTSQMIPFLRVTPSPFPSNSTAVPVRTEVRLLMEIKCQEQQVPENLPLLELRSFDSRGL